MPNAMNLLSVDSQKVRDKMRFGLVTSPSRSQAERAEELKRFEEERASLQSMIIQQQPLYSPNNGPDFDAFYYQMVLNRIK